SANRRARATPLTTTVNSTPSNPAARLARAGEAGGKAGGESGGENGGEAGGEAGGENKRIQIRIATSGKILTASAEAGPSGRSRKRLLASAQSSQVVTSQLIHRH